FKPWDPVQATKLLRGRTLAHVQEMCTVAMTLQPGGRDDWLVTCPDFGISAVLWKATFLDEEVRRLERAAAATAEAEAREAEREAMRARGDAAREATVQAAAAAYERLDADARAELEREAREELNDFRPPRMNPADFEARVQLGVRRRLQDPHVRERFGVEQPREKFG